MNKDTQKLLNLRNKYLSRSIYIDSERYFMFAPDRFIANLVQKYMRNKMSTKIDKYLKKYSADIYTLLKNLAYLYNSKEFTCRYKDYPQFCTKVIADSEWKSTLGFFANIQEIKVDSEKVYVVIKITCTGYDLDGDIIPFKHAIYSFVVTENSIDCSNRFYGFNGMDDEQLKLNDGNATPQKTNKDIYNYYVLNHTIIDITKLVLMEGI